MAHSQGNLFTSEAYNNLDSWMTKYFSTIAVATPGSSIANGGSGVTFHNDIILKVPGAMQGRVKIENENSYDYYKTDSQGEPIKLLTNQKSSN